MSRSKRTYRNYWEPLRNLLQRIDLAVDEYVNRENNQKTYKEILGTPDSLDNLLYSLKKYHPLNCLVRMHGRRVYSRVHFDFGNPKNDWWLEERVREAFQLKESARRPGALRRDLSHIMGSIAAPFEFLLDKVMVLYAMIREMRKK